MGSNKKKDAIPIGEVLPEIKGDLSNLINPDEEYILTPEEERDVIAHHVYRLKEHAAWVMEREVGVKTQDEVLKKLNNIDFEKQVDRDAVLKYANSCKHQKIWQEANQKKSEEEAARKQKELRESWTARRIYSLMQYVSSTVFKVEMVIDDDNRHLIKTVCFYLSEDPRFESELGYSFRKGLLVRGISGLGKSFVFECSAKNELNPILIVSMLDVEESIRQTGEFIIPMKHEKVLCLDDVGTEEAIAINFGNRINFFKNFMEQTYHRNKHNGFGKLVVSTNLNFDQLEQKYGFRLRSRMKDMFNVVDVTGTDRRGRK